jgi:phage terminase Nu1 subunit (DNA packaging protein)
MAANGRLTKDEVLAIFEWNKTTFKKRMAAGLADAQITKDLFTASEVMKWYVNNIADAPGEEAGAPETQDLKYHQTRLEKARSEKEMLKVQNMADDYLDFAEITNTIIELDSILAEVLDPMPAEITERILGKSENEIMIEIDKYIRARLTKRANNEDTRITS